MIVRMLMWRHSLDLCATFPDQMIALFDSNWMCLLVHKMV